MGQCLEHGSFTVLAQFSEQRAVEHFDGQHAFLEPHGFEFGEDRLADRAFERIGDFLEALKSAEGFAAEEILDLITQRIGVAVAVAWAAGQAAITIGIRGGHGGD
jgi:hypothetical protein